MSDKEFMEQLPMASRCYDPKHIGGTTGYCWIACGACLNDCNKAYQGHSGKQLREMEQLVNAD